MATVYKAPENPDFDDNNFSIFLAGSIEMGKAIDWQTKVEKGLADIPDLNIMNPRRDDWDSSWEQTIENEQFRTQVEWELSKLEEASIVIVYFDPKTESPITLLELGKFSNPNTTIVCCPEGFFRKGNVDIFCNRYGITQVDTIEELIAEARKMIIKG